MSKFELTEEQRAGLANLEGMGLDAETIRVLAGGTPGELTLAVWEAANHEEAVAHFRVAIAPHENSNLLVLVVKGAGDGAEDKAIAIFGNGPDADANIRRFCAAGAIVLPVLAQLGAAAGEIAQAEAALAASQAEAAGLREAMRAATKDLALTASWDTPGAGAVVMSTRWTLADALAAPAPNAARGAALLAVLAAAREFMTSIDMGNAPIDAAFVERQLVESEKAERRMADALRALDETGGEL